MEIDVKRPKSVGDDFDAYAERWAESEYRLEIGGDAQGVVRDDAGPAPQRPGDEWGDPARLLTQYQALIARLLPGDRPVNVLEIGPGGGRSTAAMLECLGDRAADYHAIDVSERFTQVLRERVGDRVALHIVDDVNLTSLPEHHFDLCLAQSSWSHISLYDQYRYLRDLRRVLVYEAPVVVSGIFVLGLGHDWGWNRFRRRVYQLEHQVEGVFHEFTGAAMLVEQLQRLEYRLEVVAGDGFVARRIQANPQADVSTADAFGPVVVPTTASLAAYCEGTPTRTIPLFDY